MDALWSHIGITWIQVGGVAVAACILYLVFAAVLRLWGQRARPSTSTLTFALWAVLGSLVARSMLGDAPTLLGGLVAMATLVSLEAVFGALRLRLDSQGAVSSRRARILVVNGEISERELRAARLSEHELAVRLRQSGALSYADLGLVILESSGNLTIVPEGSRIDPRLLFGVRGASMLPAELIAPLGGST